MRICIIGKYPPIQGGVSMRTYWNAHRLAQEGHEVHVVTNAKEARPPNRIHMRSADWERCEAIYGIGSVTAHWTDPVDRSQAYNPMAPPFVSKLATTVARAHAEHRFDVIFSHYMEPYGIAGHLAAEMGGVPHVTRMAGSDAGRLWHHPQLEGLYDHVLRSAESFIATGKVAERAIQRGVSCDRIAIPGGFTVPEEVFTPEGPSLDIAELRGEVDKDPQLRALMWGSLEPDRPYFGMCGKLSESKGSFAALAALQRLKKAGLKIGLVLLAHGEADVEFRFRAMAQELGVTDCILQLPFLPHWRVPEFLRGCLAVCCLEQSFLIGFHAPTIPREVLLCGTCLVGSTEVIRKLPMYEQLPDGYGCVAIEDVNDGETLSARLAAIAADPELAAVVGARGHAFAQALQRDALYPSTMESILEAASARRPIPTVARWRSERTVGTLDSASFATEAGQAEAVHQSSPGQSQPGDEATASVLRTAEDGSRDRTSFVEDQIERALAAVEREEDGDNSAEDGDPLFRLRIKPWAMATKGLDRLIPIRDPRLRLVDIDRHRQPFQDAQARAPSLSEPDRCPRQIVVFVRSQGKGRSPCHVDEATAQILKLSDGTHTALEIAKAVAASTDHAVVASSCCWR